MGLTVSVYRAGRGDFTNGGISAKHDDLTVVNVVGPFAPTPSRPPVLLVDGARGTKRVVPAYQDSDGAWWMVAETELVGPMMGGNYASSSDSRWTSAVGFYGAVAIHDRYETPEQYRSLSS